MTRVVYIGDEVTATAMRLAGVETRFTEPGATADELRRVLADEAELVLLSGALTEYVPGAELDAALSATQPLLLIVPDLCGHAVVPDLKRAVRGTLGIDA